MPQLGVIVPHLVVRDTAEALAFYERAFGATVLYRSPSPSGDGEHLHLKLWDSLVQVSSEEPIHQQRRVEGALLVAPESLGGSTFVFQVSVPDVDAAYKKAVDRGAVQLSLPPRCSGKIVIDGSAIRLAICGRSFRFRKFSRLKKWNNGCVVLQRK